MENRAANCSIRTLSDLHSLRGDVAMKNWRSYEEHCAAEVRWYRANGQFQWRIRFDRHGIEYVVAAETRLSILIAECLTR